MIEQNESTLCFMIEGLARCGTTTVARVLDCHPHIRCSLEPFNPCNFGGKYHDIAMRAGTVAPAVHLLRREYNCLKHVWDPHLGWPFLRRHSLNDELLSHVETVISVRRRNLLRQVVSKYIALHLDFWIGTKEEFRSRIEHTELPALNAAVIAAELRLLQRALLDRDRNVHDLSINKITLYYEDLFETPPDVAAKLSIINRLVARLGFEPKWDRSFVRSSTHYLDNAIFKWASNEIYDRIPGSREIDALLGSNETGRLFD